MKNSKHGYSIRITLDCNTLIIDRVCVSRSDDAWGGPAEVVELLDAEQDLMHAIVEWLRPKVVYTDNHGPESVRLKRACARLGVAVIRPPTTSPRAKGRAERLRALHGRATR